VDKGVGLGFELTHHDVFVFLGGLFRNTQELMMFDGHGLLGVLRWGGFRNIGGYKGLPALVINVRVHIEFGVCCPMSRLQSLRQGHHLVLRFVDDSFNGLVGYHGGLFLGTF